MGTWRKKIVIVLIIVGSVFSGALVTFLLTRPHSEVPADIRSSITFSPLVPTDSANIESSNYKLAKVENETQTLSYVMTINETRVVVSQYPQPDQFTDVPEYKERFLSNVLNQTSSVQTAAGVIYVGQADTDNRQIAVMLERGLLVFLNPTTTLTNETWRIIGDSLIVEKSTS